MCGRYTMHHSPQQVEMRFGITQARTTTTERYNIAPTQSVPVVVEGDGACFLDAMQWGLIPSWAKEPGIGNLGANRLTILHASGSRNTTRKEQGPMVTVSE
jgi:putative SOS response-associated peptidase YedK